MKLQIVGLVQLTILLKHLYHPSARLDDLGSPQMSVDRRWASKDVVVEDKAASAAIFLEDAAPVGLLSTLLVANVAESSKD